MNITNMNTLVEKTFEYWNPLVASPWEGSSSFSSVWKMDKVLLFND
jgi:hypothetical protein